MFCFWVGLTVCRLTMLGMCSIHHVACGCMIEDSAVYTFAIGTIAWTSDASNSTLIPKVGHPYALFLEVWPIPVRTAEVSKTALQFCPYD